MRHYGMRLTLLGLFVLLPALASAQTPLLPGQLVSFEVDPGTKQESPTSPNVIARPEANVVFEYRIDGAATPVAAVKNAPCTLVAAGPTLTCRLKAPTLTPGTHQIEIRALASPVEAGINPSGYSAPLGVTSILITGPGTPSNTRITSAP